MRDNRQSVEQELILRDIEGEIVESGTQPPSIALAMEVEHRETEHRWWQGVMVTREQLQDIGELTKYMLKRDIE